MSEQSNNTTATAPAITPELQLAKFGETFSLQSEVIGQVVRKKVSGKGAVRVDLMSRKDMGALLSIKGEALDVKMREASVELKGQMAQGFASLAANPNWVGRAITMNAKGDVVSFHLKKVKPLVISAPKAKVTDEDAAKLLGVPVEKLAEARKALQDLGLAPAAKPEDKKEDESETGAGQPASNGAVEPAPADAPQE